MTEVTKAIHISHGTALNLSIFLGWLGADRFYIGDTGLGLLKLCTLGGVGVWWIIDIITMDKHRTDWDSWISEKQTARNEQQEARRAQRALMQERVASGQCPKCGSDRLQAIAVSSGGGGSSGGCCNCCCVPGGAGYISPVKTETARMCLNCGKKF